MQTLESSTALEHDALQTAINTSKDAAYVRGVKRLCVGTGESAEHADGGDEQTKPPFVETKWDSEASRKRRESRALGECRCVVGISLNEMSRQITRYAL